MRKGSKHTPEARQKMGEAQKGKILSEKTRRKISEALKGKILSEETRRKISEAKIGLKHSKEILRKISESNKGRTFSEETRRKISVAQKGKRLGEKHPNWKGGRMINSRGYVYIRINGEYIGEHRVVMSQYLGRPLTSEEVVHHKNGVRANNKLENLELMTKSIHARHHRIESGVVVSFQDRKHSETAKRKMSESQKKRI